MKTKVNEGSIAETAAPKKNSLEPKKVKVKLRKHRVENINRNQLAQVLDTYSAEGRVVLALNISRDIGGTYEVVSYKDEALTT